jgi:hypothetical protein
VNFGTVVAQYLLNYRFFNSNYSRIMLQSSGHLATERPYYILETLPIILKFLSEIIISPEDETVFKIDEITTK